MSQDTAFSQELKKISPAYKKAILSNQFHWWRWSLYDQPAVIQELCILLLNIVLYFHLQD